MMRVTMLLVICTSRNSASIPWATVTSRSPAPQAVAENTGNVAPSTASSIAMERMALRIEPSLPGWIASSAAALTGQGSAVMVCPWKKGVKDAHVLDTAPPWDLHGYHLTTWAGHAPWVNTGAVVNLVLPRAPLSGGQQGSRSDRRPPPLCRHDVHRRHPPLRGAADGG